ncbi:MAG TPA: DNA repair protein RecN [Vicinamibacterales bacterium]|nr:DNA repair protein RecN [Vicinamibacterales bacterium]
MLRFLRIRNLAVIESVEVEFEPGFNVLTGETGAGKSILVEAVGLLLGARASSDLVRTGEAQATIEAIFEDHREPGAGPLELIIRREITIQGRSRSFINGALATAVALRDLSRRLVELHGQHEHQALLDPSTHLFLIDEYAGLEEDVAAVASKWSGVRTLREQLDRSRMDAREKSARLDLIAFQLGEIEKAAPRPGEDDELAATKQVLASAERIQRLCEESYSSLYESDGAILSDLGGVWKRVGELATIDPRFAPYVDARDGIKGQLEDLAFFLRSYSDGVDASPERLQQVEDRLALLERLKRKHGPTLQDVIEKGDALRREQAFLSGASEEAGELQRRLDDAADAFLQRARAVSRARRSAAVKFAAGIEAMLAELAMARTRFEVRFNASELPPDAWSERGIDQAEFFLSANVGEDVRPLARIVSGGELSRVMLALKAMGARAGKAAQSGGQSRTLIFDEVDAGIGGRVADVVGTKLRELGGEFQVLCITHLPQIAAKATTHFHIDKRVRGTRTLTSVGRLDEHTRVDEIARMIGGAQVSDAALSTARDLLAAGRVERPGRKAKAKGESESPWRRNT